MKQFQAEKLDLKSMVRIFGGLDPVQITTITETETTITETTDGYNDHNNNGQQDECETVWVNSVTTIKK